MKQQNHIVTGRHWPMVSIYSVTHFLIDFSCAFLMFYHIAGIPEGYLCVLYYNFCAFAMQMPLGILADRINRNHLFAAAGCVLAAGAYGLGGYPVMLAVALGLGNGMFHVGGGIDVLNISETKLNALGVFVSPGALGIYLGTMMGKEGSLAAVFPPVLLMSAAGLIVLLHKVMGRTWPQNAAFSLAGVKASSFPVMAACLFFVVVLRSFVGLTVPFAWKSTGYWGIILVGAVVLGKTLGGYAADRFGVIQTVLWSSAGAALLFIGSPWPLTGITAILLFNMSMPITLWVMARLLPGAKGFAFGLLTFALFLGYLPVHLGLQLSADVSPLFVLPAAVSCLLLWLGLR